MDRSTELSIVIRARDEASRTLRKIQAETKSMAQSVGSSIGGFVAKNYQAAAAAAGTLLAAVGLATKAGLEQAEAYQQNRVAFDTMLGSADKARTLLKQLSDFAAKTPFSLPEVVEGGKRLLAYNIAAEKIIPTFNALGNIAAGVGKDKLPQLILAFGQVRAAGKLTGAELRQFTEAGVPLLDELAKQAGKTAGQIKEEMEGGAAPSFDTVEKALFSMSQNGGRFFNLLEKQSQTFGGRMSNLNDQVGRVVRKIIGIDEAGDVREGSLFDVASKGAANLLTALERATPHIEAFFGFFEKNKVAVAAVVGAIGGLVVLIAGALIAAFGGALLVMAGFMAAGAAIAALVHTIVSNWGGIVSFFSGLWEGIKAAFSNGVNSVVTWFKQLPTRIWQFILNIGEGFGWLVGRMIRFVLIDVPNFIGGVINWFAQLPGRVWSFLAQLPGQLANLAGSLWAGARNLGSRVVSGIMDFISALPGRVSSAFWDVVHAIGGFAQHMWNKAKELASRVWEGFKKGLGISSPSYIERAFMRIQDESARTLKQVNWDVKRISSGMDAVTSVVGGSGVLPAVPTSITAASSTGAFSQPSATTGVTINQVNHNYSPFDLQGANRELGWRLANA